MLTEGVEREAWLPLNDLGELMHTNVYFSVLRQVDQGASGRKDQKKKEMREGVFADVHLLRTNQEGPSPANG